MTRSPVLIALALLAACGKADNEPGPGGVTVGEARALDEAAAMVEQQRLPPEAIPAPRATPAQTKPKPPG